MVRPLKARQTCMFLCVGSRDRNTVGVCMEAQQRFCLLASFRSFMCVGVAASDACEVKWEKRNDP